MYSNSSVSSGIAVEVDSCRIAERKSVVIGTSDGTVIMAVRQSSWPAGARHVWLVDLLRCGFEVGIGSCTHNVHSSSNISCQTLLWQFQCSSEASAMKLWLIH